jgi:Protein of unknown function (DUF1559)
MMHRWFLGCVLAGMLSLTIGTGCRESSPESDGKEYSKENLAKIGTAIRKSGGAIYGKYELSTGKPGLSWRYVLLPALGEAPLASEFDDHEAWDSPKNKPLLEKMPEVFRPTRGKAPPGYTYFRAWVGPKTFFPTPKGIAPDDRKPAWARPPVPFASLQPQQVTDGTSYTMMIVEAGDPVPWTKPEELEYDETKPLPKLGGLFEDGFHALFVDGAVRWVPRSLPERTLRALITANGKELDIDPTPIGLEPYPKR